MMPVIIQDVHLAQLSTFVAEKLGLYYPRERWDDLQRGFVAAAQELGFDHAEDYLRCLLAGVPKQAYLQVLASHLTIGETYFFRDEAVMEALVQRVLPEIIRRRRGHEQRLHVWSAGCSGGEEAYTLAILLHQLLPDIADWKVTIHATDINLHFLDKATQGIYSAWSFRNAPLWLKKRYFNASADGHYCILPEIKKLVSFDYLNLVDDDYPLFADDTNFLDLIVCRNVLMYFSPAQAQRVISNLSQALTADGWLVLGAGEVALLPQFTRVQHGLFQKDRAAAITRPEPALAVPVSALTLVAPDIASASLPHPAANLAQGSAEIKDAAALAEHWLLAQSLYAQGRYAEVVTMLAERLAEPGSKPVDDAAVFSLMLRALVSQGELTAALACCNRQIAADKTNADSYYMRALILLELGDSKSAAASLQQVIFLRPDSVLAYFALGNIARSSGKMDAACRYFSIVKRLLSDRSPHDGLAETDGLAEADGFAVEQLTKIINAMPLMAAAL